MSKEGSAFTLLGDCTCLCQRPSQPELLFAEGLAQPSEDETQPPQLLGQAAASRL